MIYSLSTRYKHEEKQRAAESRDRKEEQPVRTEGRKKGRKSGAERPKSGADTEQTAKGKSAETTRAETAEGTTAEGTTAEGTTADRTEQTAERAEGTAERRRVST